MHTGVFTACHSHYSARNVQVVSFLFLKLLLVLVDYLLDFISGHPKWIFSFSKKVSGS